MINNPNQICFTCNPFAEANALDEIIKFDSQIKIIKKFRKGIFMIETADSFTTFSEYFKDNMPVFIRHISPINASVRISNNIIEDISACLDNNIMLFQKDKSFSVQTRIFGKSLNRYEINNSTAEYLTYKGYSLDVKEPDQVISIITDDEKLYIGFSMSAENLSSWPGGEYRFRYEREQISRAEFKLLEAMQVFGINILPGSKALDIGAAPGGWTRILLNKGCKVVAVDPADMNAEIMKHKNLEFHKQRIQDYIRRKPVEFDLITNDMRIDAVDAAKIMLSLSGQLKSNGYALLTLKLPRTNFMATFRKALKILEAGYNRVSAKQLFHNRSEITVFLNKQSPYNSL